MEAHIHEWANLLVRWIHFIVGVAWIGASFYFNWLENNLDRKSPQDEGIAGNLWAVHGGGFYHLKKFTNGPASLPPLLHWFKWEAYTTWLSGFTLLVVVYYFNARLFLLDPEVADLSPMVAIAIGLAALLASWLIYDALCKSSLKNQPLMLSAALFALFIVLAFGLTHVFSGRGAFIHAGAAIGTIMVANVFFGIIPAQKEMVAALSDNRPLDPAFGKDALLRSRHNNYLTLPVLFIMISNHFPSTYGHKWNWLVLLLVSAISIVVRHYFNVRKTNKSLIWILPAAFVAMLTVMWATAPEQKTAGPAVSTSAIVPIVKTRCAVCHSSSPTQPGFSAPPAGLAFENEQQIVDNASRIYNAAFVTKTMPLANLTGITPEERQQLADWYTSLTTD